MIYHTVFGRLDHLDIFTKTKKYKIYPNWYGRCVLLGFFTLMKKGNEWEIIRVLPAKKPKYAFDEWLASHKEDWRGSFR
jgi:hypothetical protein